MPNCICDVGICMAAAITSSRAGKNPTVEKRRDGLWQHGSLSCESTVDLPYRDMEQRNIPVLFYSYVVDGTAYLDDMGRDPAALPRFYQFLEEGKAPSTSQLNTFQYLEFFEPLLQQG